MRFKWRRVVELQLRHERWEKSEGRECTSCCLCLGAGMYLGRERQWERETEREGMGECSGFSKQTR